MPENIRADYELFANRCSKCHSLARPLTSNITDDEQWVLYVNRMRRQPGSGISRTDQDGILRFLKYYAADLRRTQAEKNERARSASRARPHRRRGGAVMRSARFLLVALSTLMAALLALATPASAIERNFAGSAQLDYQFVPTARDAKASPSTFDGFTMEFAGKLAVDFSDKISANMKVCYGCHGFEADMMYFDLRVADELNFRVGRFSPSFGAFNLRHDPANHRLSDKPLPYDMGRMLRMRQWKHGVLPSPFPDNGLEVNGTKCARLVGAARLRGVRRERLQGRTEPARHRLLALAQPAGLLRRRQLASHVRRSRVADVQARRDERPHARRERHVRHVRPHQRSVLFDRRR